MPANKTLITSNDCNIGPGSYETENKFKEQINPRNKNKGVFSKTQKKEVLE
jgi:hypothetical protein